MKNRTRSKPYEARIRHRRCFKLSGISVFIFFFLYGILGISREACAQDFNYKVNATYVYYFLKYIEWPVDNVKPGTITIGILGDSPVLNDLQSILVNKKVNALPVLVKRIDLSEVKSCQVIIISKSQSNTMRQVQEATKGLPILLVTEKPGLTTKGADICIYVDDEDSFKTKFELSKNNMQVRKLKVSNDLTALAEVVN